MSALRRPQKRKHHQEAIQNKKEYYDDNCWLPTILIIGVHIRKVTRPIFAK